MNDYEIVRPLRGDSGNSSLGTGQGNGTNQGESTVNGGATGNVNVPGSGGNSGWTSEVEIPVT